MLPRKLVFCITGREDVMSVPKKRVRALVVCVMGILRFVIAGFDVLFLAGWHIRAKLC